MFSEVGIKHVKSYLSDEIKNNLNNEIEEISNKYLINGVTRASTWVNRNLYEISNPIVNINKVNLLEVALDVHKQIVLATSKDFILSNFRIIIEKQNSHPLEWHTDHAPNKIRAIIYLMGGEKNNGGLSYIKGSHKNLHNKKIHKINPKEENLVDQIVSLDSQSGDLIFFDVNGFHKKNVVKNERRILYLEFQEKSSDQEKEKIILDNSKFSSKIKNNLNFLFFLNDKTKLVPPIYSDTLPSHTPLKVFLYYIKTFFKISINRILKRLKFLKKN